MSVKVVCLILLLPAFVLAAQRGSPCTTPNGEKATCSGISTCTIIRDAVLTRDKNAIEFAQQSQCGYDREALICCGSASRKGLRPTPCVTPNGDEAICRPVSSCKVILDAVATRDKDAIEFAQKSQCGYDREALVCCGSEGYYTKSISPLLPAKSECGIPKGDRRIYGGEITDLNEFPWMALLGYKNNDGSDAGFNCGGTMINQRYVLTAAHCIVIDTRYEYQLESVRLGEWRISTVEDCEDHADLANKECADPVVDLKIEEQIPHPQYSIRSARNDIALLRLERNVEFTDYILPICLPRPGAPVPAVGTKLFVAGWGKTENSSSSDTKLKVELPIVPSSGCSSTIGSRQSITEKQLCAGGVSGKDSCYGDSGGPLMGTYPTEPEQWVQVGVVSWGYGCAANIPAVYTSVSMYTQWIVDNMKEF